MREKHHILEEEVGRNELSNNDLNNDNDEEDLEVEDTEDYLINNFSVNTAKVIPLRPKKGLLTTSQALDCVRLSMYNIQSKLL